jgi:hypothetical protein
VSCDQAGGVGVGVCVDILDEGLFQLGCGFSWVRAKGTGVALWVTHSSILMSQSGLPGCGRLQLAQCVGFWGDEFEGPPRDCHEQSAVGGAFVYPFEVGSVAALFPCWQDQHCEGGVCGELGWSAQPS